MRSNAKDDTNWCMGPSGAYARGREVCSVQYVTRENVICHDTEGLVSTWNPLSGTQTQLFCPTGGRESTVTLKGLAVSPDRSLIAISGYPRVPPDGYKSETRLFQVASGERLASLPESGSICRWTLDGRFLAIGYKGDPSIHVFEARSGVKTGEVKVASELVDFAIFDDYGLVALSGKHDAKWDHIIGSKAVVQRFHIKDGKAARAQWKYEFKDRGVGCLTVSDSGNAAFVSVGRHIYTLDLSAQTSTPLIKQFVLESTCNGLKVSSDGSLLALHLLPFLKEGFDERTACEIIRVLQVDDRSVIYEITDAFIGSSGDVHFAWSDDRRVLVAAGYHGLYAWDLNRKCGLHENWHYAPIIASLTYRGGAALVTASQDGTLRSWCTKTRLEQWRFVAPELAYRGCTLEATSTGIVKIVATDGCRLVDIETGTQLDVEQR